MFRIVFHLDLLNVCSSIVLLAYEGKREMKTVSKKNSRTFIYIIYRPLITSRPSKNKQKRVLRSTSRFVPSNNDEVMRMSSPTPPPLMHESILVLAKIYDLAMTFVFQRPIVLMFINAAQSEVSGFVMHSFPYSW